MPRAIVALLVANLILSSVALGWLAWISVDPQYWFPGAYAEQGPRGERGTPGPVGPAGPAGPVGPDAANAIDELSSQVDDVAVRLDDLESGSGTSDVQSSVDDLASRMDDLESAVNDTLCPWVSEASDYVYSC